MQPTIREKLEQLRERHQEVEAALADPEVIQNTDEFRRLSKEYSRLEPVTRALMISTEPNRPSMRPPRYSSRAIPNSRISRARNCSARKANWKSWRTG